MELTLGPWKIGQHILTDDERGLISLKQVHGNRIVSVPAHRIRTLVGDGIYLKEPGVTIGIRTADCLPLILLTNEAGLALHVSRKSALAGLLDNVGEYIDVSSITQAWIGPHICANHFLFEHLGKEIEQFQNRFPFAVIKEDPWHLSLRHVVQAYLDSWNVVKAIVQEDTRCTYEDKQLPSYKRWLAGGKAGSLPHLVTSLTWLQLNGSIYLNTSG